MRVMWTVCILLILSACAQSSGVQKLGPDTYTVSVHAAPARGGESGARGIALGEAREFCEEQHKEILVNNVGSRPSSHFPGGTVEIMFRCLAVGDPGLQRPSYGPAPSIIIEDHRGRR
jgi:hypothetical protein